MACALLLIIPNHLEAVPPSMSGARWIEVANVLSTAVLWGLVFAAAAWLWPDGVPAWGAVIMPSATLMLGIGFGTFEPRYMSWFLGSQATMPQVVHIARLGGELAVAPLLALSATVPVMLLAQLPPSLSSRQSQ